MDVFNKESDFEEALIKLLFEKGWSSDVLRYKTEKDLIRNWANILYANNNQRDRLNDCPLTDSEMDQIIEQIKENRTPVKLNEFINGKTISIKRDNQDDDLHFGKTISLTLYERQAIAGGSSVYQIAQQPIFPAKNKMLNSRRGDFVLLINGMPVIHVELKKSGIPVSQACYQIEKYSHEGVFTGLFSLVQVFVAMNPDEALYFANPGPDGKFNDNYYFHWADFNNEPINNWTEITSTLLSIPMAHQLIGFYTVADSTDGILKVMRSYQYYAASAISNRVATRKWQNIDQRGGYIWHTTGSGKTLTSFKSAQLIADSGDADKVVFLVDRIELGTQSLQEYQGFASDREHVRGTENTGVLLSALKSTDTKDTLIVTSIQKMSRIYEEGGYNQRDIDTINKKRIVFIIDEAHRDTFGEMLHTIKETFPRAMFFGFTGTPILDENNKKHSVTADVFGRELHRYSIADGIRDKNVLGFDPTMVTTFKDSDIRQAVALDQAKAKTIDEVKADPKRDAIYSKFMDKKQIPMAGYREDDGSWHKGIEDYVPKSQYSQKKHRQAVVKDICEKWPEISRSARHQFHAIFATSSINEAIEYYKIFKNEHPELKVYALYNSAIDNNDGAIEKEDATVEILDDYNERFKTNFTIPTYASYKKDISLRLAHKTPYVGIENDRDKQIDILIVVDQMLTGFDSKWINTLYLDKKIGYERLIQAFSRTNRLFGEDKPHGIIRYYRYPHTMERNVEEAFKLYSGDKAFGIFVDKLDKNLMKMNEIFDEIDELFASAGVSNFEKLPDEKTVKAKFAKLFKEFNNYLEAAYVQGYSWKQLEYKFKKPGRIKLNITVHLDKTTYLTLVLRYKELFSGGGGDGDETPPYEIEPYLVEIDTDRIDSDYMNTRFKKFLKALTNGENVESVLNELHKSFATLSQEEQKYANIFLIDVQQGDIVVDEKKTLTDYINQYRLEAHNDRVHAFATAIGVDEQELRDLMNRHVTSDNINEFGYFDKLKSTTDKEKAKEYFEKIDGSPIKSFKVVQRIDKELRKFILSGGFDIDE